MVRFVFTNVICF